MNRRLVDDLKWAKTLFLSSAMMIFSQTAFAQYEPQKISLGIYDRDEYLCETWADIGTPQRLELKVDRDSFLKCLSKKLSPEAVDQLHDEWLKYPSLTVDNINRSALTTKVSLDYFRVDLTIPETWLKREKISLRPEDEVSLSDLKPSPFSSYLNYSFNKTLGQTVYSPVLLINPVAGWKGNTFESYHQLNSSGSSQRLESRVTHDFENSLVRGVVGDQYTKQTPMMSPIRIVGLAVNREFDIAPGFVNRPLGSREIFLDQPSRVDLFVNGILFRTFNLPPGRHLIEDIPVNQGTNNVTLRITDPNGESRLIQFQSSTEENLLRNGLSDYSFQAGMISDTLGDNSLHYQSHAALSAYFRRGFTDSYTAGLFTQATQEGALGGVEQTFVNSRGIFHFALAGSETGAQAGCAGRFEYAWSCPCSFGGRGARFGFGSTWYSPNFLISLAPAQTAINQNRWSLFPSYSFAFGDGFSAQVRGAYNQRFDEALHSITASADLNKTILKNLFISAGYSRDLQLGGNTVHTVTLQAVLQLDDGHETISNISNLSPGQNTERLDAYYNSRKQVNNLIAQGFSESSTGAPKTGVLLAYATQFADLNGGITHDPSSNEKFALNLNPAGSLVFSDGVFGLGRPIRDSFVVIKNDHDREILVNGPEDYEARIPPRWSGVLTNVQAYRRKSVAVIDQTSDPYGYSLNQTFFLRPTYKTGSLVRVERAHIYGATGFIKDSSGKLAKLSAGRFVSKDGKNEISFFTDYDGKFLLEQIPPAIYTVSVFNLPYENSTIDLTHIKDRMTDLHTINLTKIVGGAHE